MDNPRAASVLACVSNNELVWGENKCHMSGFKYASLRHMMNNHHVQIIKGAVVYVSGFIKSKEFVLDIGPLNWSVTIGTFRLTVGVVEA